MHGLIEVTRLWTKKGTFKGIELKSGLLIAEAKLLISAKVQKYKSWRIPSVRESYRLKKFQLSLDILYGKLEKSQQLQQVIQSSSQETQQLRDRQEVLLLPSPEQNKEAEKEDEEKEEPNKQLPDQ